MGRGLPPFGVRPHGRRLYALEGPGAQAIRHVRAVHINDEAKAVEAFRIAREQDRLYGNKPKPKVIDLANWKERTIMVIDRHELGIRRRLSVVNVIRNGHTQIKSSGSSTRRLQRHFSRWG